MKISQYNFIRITKVKYVLYVYFRCLKYSPPWNMLFYSTLELFLISTKISICSIFSCIYYSYFENYKSVVEIIWK